MVSLFFSLTSILKVVNASVVVVYISKVGVVRLQHLSTVRKVWRKKDAGAFLEDGSIFSIKYNIQVFL